MSYTGRRAPHRFRPEWSPPDTLAHRSGRSQPRSVSLLVSRPGRRWAFEGKHSGGLQTRTLIAWVGPASSPGRLVDARRRLFRPERDLVALRSTSDHSIACPWGLMGLWGFHGCTGSPIAPRHRPERARISTVSSSGLEASRLHSLIPEPPAGFFRLHSRARGRSPLHSCWNKPDQHQRAQ